MVELEDQFNESNEQYNEAKSALEQRQKTANDKAFNKASADSIKTKEALAAATKAVAETKKVAEAKTAAVIKQNKVITDLTAAYNANNTDDLFKQITNAKGAISNLNNQNRDAQVAYNAAKTLLGEATTADATV